MTGRMMEACNVDQSLIRSLSNLLRYLHVRKEVMG